MAYYMKILNFQRPGARPGAFFDDIGPYPGNPGVERKSSHFMWL
jgi:hypothetical protein